MIHGTIHALSLVVAATGNPGVHPDSDEVRALVSEVMRDAEARTSLLADPATAGHDGANFFLSDAAGDYKLKLGGGFQTRYIANFRDENGEQDDFEGGFQQRRTRLEFSGNVVSPKWTYLVMVDFNRATGNATLLDGWVRYAISKELGVRAGQFKVPLLREEVMSWKYQLTAERSITNAVFTQARSQGVMLEWESDSVRLSGAVSDGLGTLNTDFDNAAEADYALTGRVDWKIAGDWKQFRDFTSFRGVELAALLGAAVHWQQTDTFAPGGDSDVLEYTTDVGVEGSGWNLYAAFIGRQTEPDAGDEFNDFGALVQGGVFLTESAEAFARYDVTIPDDDRSAGSDEFQTVTAGVNYYVIPKSHAIKLTVDVQWSLDPLSDSASIVRPNSGLGLLADTEGDQVAVRAQLNLLF